MRLTLSTLPQLAVLAKILCLLMVVMCGAVPAMVRSVSLYSPCSSGNLTVYGRTVKATSRNGQNAPYQKLTTQSEDFSRKLYIYAEESKRYICFSKRWKVVTFPKKKRNELCQFYEIYNGRYLMYRSVVEPSKLLGFNKKGKPMTSPRGRQECYNFIKLNPNANVDQHNEIVASSRGGLKRRPDRHNHHHHHTSNSNSNNSNNKNYDSNNRINNSSSNSSNNSNTGSSNSNNSSSSTNSKSSNLLVNNSRKTLAGLLPGHHKHHHKNRHRIKNSPKNLLLDPKQAQKARSASLGHHRHRHGHTWKMLREVDARKSQSSSSSAMSALTGSSARRKYHTLREDQY